MKRTAEDNPDELKAQIDTEEKPLAPVPAAEVVVAAADSVPVAEVVVTEAAAAAVPKVEEEKKEKWQDPNYMGKKLRIAILTGYNGVDFCGS